MDTVATAIAVLLGVWTAGLISAWRHNRRTTAAIAASRAQLTIAQAYMVTAQAQLDRATVSMSKAGDALLTQAQDIVQAYAAKVAAIVSEVDEDAGKALIDEANKVTAQIEVQRVMRRTSRQ